MSGRFFRPLFVFTRFSLTYSSFFQLLPAIAHQMLVPYYLATYADASFPVNPVAPQRTKSNFLSFILFFSSFAASYLRNTSTLSRNFNGSLAGFLHSHLQGNVKHEKIFPAKTHVRVKGSRKQSQMGNMINKVTRNCTNYLL